MLSRRSFCAVAAAGLIEGGRRSALAQSPATAGVDADLDDFIGQEVAESRTEPEIRRLSGDVSTWQQVDLNKDTVDKRKTYKAFYPQMRSAYETEGDGASSWPLDGRSIDYAHFVELGTVGEASQRSFYLDHDVLSSIAAANGYSARIANENKVVFGLRGCRILGCASKPSQRVELLESTPNHFKMRCVIGVWDVENRLISVFKSSTVPNRGQVELHWLWNEYQRSIAAGDSSAEPIGDWMTNLLPQGLYRYMVGTHLAGAKNAARRQPSALKLASVCPVLRAQNGAAFTQGEFWDTPNHSVGDNIHAATECNGVLEFSSAGCQTIEGHYAPRGQAAVGAWEAFHRALGLDPIDPTMQTTASDGTGLFYLLTTGREARIHALDKPRVREGVLTRVRFGSYGPQAAAAQKLLIAHGHLTGEADGAFGNQSARALLAYQKELMRVEGGARRDALISADQAARLQLADW